MPTNLQVETTDDGAYHVWVDRYPGDEFDQAYALSNECEYNSPAYDEALDRTYDALNVANNKYVRMIETAPAMLEALLEVVREWDAIVFRQNNPELQRAVEMARSAIATITEVN